MQLGSVFSRAVFLLVLVPWESNGQPPGFVDLKKSFEQEAPRQWQVYGMFSKHLQGSVVTTRIDRTGKDKVPRRHRVRELSCEHGSLFEDSFLGPDDFRQYGYVKNKSYAFEVRRKTDTDSWMLTNLEAGSKAGTKGKLGGYLDQGSSGRFFNVFYVSAISLPDVVKKPEFEIMNMQTMKDGEGALIRLDFRYGKGQTQTKGKTYCEGGWILLDRTRKWMVREYKVDIRHSGQPGTLHHTAEFRDNGNGYPILTKVFQSRTFPEHGLWPKVDQEEIIEYRIDENTPSPEEFTLSAFGLPEPKGVAAARSTPWYLWAALVAATSFLCVLFVRWYARCFAGNGTPAA